MSNKTHVCMWDVYWKAFKLVGSTQLEFLTGHTVPLWSSGSAQNRWWPQTDQHHDGGSFQDLSLGQSFSCSLRSARGCEFSCVIALRGSVLSCCWRVISRHRTRFLTLAIREMQVETAVWCPYPSTGTTTLTLPSVDARVESPNSPLMVGMQTWQATGVQSDGFFRS